MAAINLANLRHSKVSACFSDQTCVMTQTQTSKVAFLFLRPPQLMTHKQYADMIRFLRQNCSDGAELIPGTGATHSEEKEIKSKDAFLWTLILHLQRLQRYVCTAVYICVHVCMQCMKAYY